MKTNTCCFIGHRKINETQELKSKLCEIIEKLIIKNQVDTFLFGSKSQFNSLCLKLVTQYKENYPYIKRVYVRAEYPYIDEYYKNYLLQNYEDTYYPKTVMGAGKVSYVKRNYEMINCSKFCIFYYDEQNSNQRSGTKIALNYAVKQGEEIFILPT